MTYEEAAEYILNLPKFTKKNKPEHTKRFLWYLKNPQEHMKVLHVAGTNGKGSVCAYLQAMLLSEGKTAGMFTSPHLVRLNERIAIKEEMITDEEFVEVFCLVLKAVRKMEGEGLPHPTFFEFLFGMALCAFARAGVEYAVLETGLGGRLDATNTVEHPLVSVITSIGMDHMEYLGNTVEEIAGEKAGILKEKVPVFFADSGEKSCRVIEKKAEEKHCSCKKIGKDAYEILGIRDKHIAFSPVNAYYGNTPWKLRNTGLYQVENAMLAMEVMRFLLGESGRPQRWREALAGVRREGRMEEILPDIYIDGAHNVSAVEAFAESVELSGQRCLLLFAAMQDKDYTEMIQILCKKVPADFYMVTAVGDKRTASPETLAKIFQENTDRPVLVEKSLAEAFAGLRARQDGRRIYCLGSLYLAGMIKELIQEV